MPPFKITGKGLELMSEEEYLRVINSGIKYAVECNNCNRSDKKITGDDVYRYMKMRGVTSFSPKFLQETILDKL
uniref:Uncharacterized protein n=1 Tax=Triticum urartu TaxID=4572 RepID=A0A8R7QKK4_TRIUA